MVCNLSTLHSRHHYVTDSVRILQANALKRIKYKIQTVYDILSKTYSNSTKFPNNGSGQGTGSAGTTWTFRSIPTMCVIEKTCFGCSMISPNIVYHLKNHIIGYVDDKRYYSNYWDKYKLEMITKQLQVSAQSWKDSLYTSGGKLEISKYGLYLMERKFHDDG